MNMGTNVGAGWLMMLEDVNDVLLPMTEKIKEKCQKRSCMFICYKAINVIVIINAKILTCEVLALTSG